MGAVRRALPVAFLVLTTLLVAAGCGGGRVSQKEDGLAHIRDWYSRVAPGHKPPPAWVFCLPEKSDTIYGLGFALQNMAGDEATKQSAFDNAVYNLARSIKVSVKARKYLQTEVDGLSVADNLLIEKEESIDGQIEQVVREKAGLLEHWKDMSNGVTWVLAACSVSDFEELKAGAHKGQSCSIGLRPHWMDHPPTSKSVLYGIGEARMHWNPSESYKEAERLSLVQIAEQIKAHVSSFNDSKQSEHEDYTYRIVRIATEGDLSGSDIVARWVDFKTGRAYALARMPLISVKTSILAAAKKVEAEEKAKPLEERRALSAEDIERKADAALEMMDKALDKQFAPPKAPELPPDATPPEPEPEPEPGEATPVEEAPAADEARPEFEPEAEEAPAEEAAPDSDVEQKPAPAAEQDGEEG